MDNTCLIPISSQQLSAILGHSLSHQDLERCYHQMKIEQLATGRQFWHSLDSEPGLYIVLAGKVRLFDAHENLLVSLTKDASFGESTLFPEAPFQPYLARASVNLKLVFLPAKTLLAIFNHYDSMRFHLYHQAVLRDWLMLSPAIASLRKHEGLMKALSLMERHQLPIGRFPTGLTDKKFWILRQGKLSSAKQNLSAGQMYQPTLGRACWQINQPSELFSFSTENWERAVELCPQLTKLLRSTQEHSDNADQLGIKPLSQPKIKILSDQLPKVSRAYFPSPSLRVRHWFQNRIRRYPFFEQQSTSDCGVACLIMVGRYWDKRFGVNHLRNIANVDRNGATLRGLAAAAETIGFTTRPVKASLDKLAQQSLPAIAHWNGKHYIVVYDIRGKSVVVADPAIGQRTLTYQEFRKGWNGYTLLLHPTVLLKNAKGVTPPWWQFYELAKPHWLILLEVFVASIFIQIFGLVTPLFTQLLLDRVVVQRSSLSLVAVGMGLFLFGIFRVAMIGLRQYLLDHTANRVDLSLVVGFIGHAFRLPLSYFESRYVGDIIARVQENRKIQRFLTGEALAIILDLGTVFVYLGLMFWYSWQMALMMMAIVPPFVLIALVATPFLQRISREIFSAHNQETGFLIQALTGIRTIKSMAVEQTVRWNWEELFGNSLRKNLSGQVIANTLQIFSATIETVTTTALLCFGAWQVIQNQLTIGQLVAFNMLMGNVISPFKRLTILWNELQEVVIAVERINDVIDAEPEEDLQFQFKHSLSKISGRVQFHSVTFRYHPDSEVNILENVSFEIQPGQKVAIVGRSGSGKTTLSKLILGLYPATEGKILIDGYDVSNLSLQSLRRHIGVVDQDTFVFGSTIFDNICIGHPEARLEDVIEVAQQAGVHSFIKSLPLGYETQIGEGGGLLSGGQRQRLAIARALLGNPKLLILDEATSHLDTESERLIQTNFNSFLKGRTTLVIAHRLSTILNADLILVLDRGVLVESGTHSDLMNRRGQYFCLNNPQLSLRG